MKLSTLKCTCPTILAFGLLVSWNGFGQSAAIGVWEDALRFTEYNPNFTSRMMGIGGAQTGLGADVSNAMTNPAGLGMLRRSEVSFSPSILFTRSENVYDINSQFTNRPIPARFKDANGNNLSLNTSSSAGSSRFHIGNISAAFASPKNGITGGSFRGGTFAISLSRTANFNSRRTFNAIVPYAPKAEDYGRPAGTPLTAQDSLFPGRNSYNYTYLDILSNDPTISTDIINQDLTDPRLSANEYLIRQAYSAYVLDADSNSNTFYVTAPNGDIRQSGVVQTRGKSQQLDFAYGANFSDKFFIGGGIGIPIIDYNEQITYDEQIVKTIFPTSLTRTQSGAVLDYSFWNNFVTRRQIDLTSSGVGINARVGVLYKVNDFFRIGGSIQTPSALRIKNQYSTTLSADFGKINIYYPTGNLAPGLINGSRDRIYETKYNITSPWKVSAGASLLSNTLGFVSADVTYINYPMSSIRGKQFDLSGDKDQIRKMSKGVLQMRIGGEYRYDILRLRAGGGYLPDPFKSGRDMAFFSGGVGVRLNDYYIDLGFQRYVQTRSYQVYNASESLFATAPINSTLNNTMVQLTFGTFF